VGTRAARDAVRDVVPFLEVDRELRADMDACVRAVRDGRLVAAVESAVGPLD
jgi:histidine ammonia-lyase